MQIFHFDTRKKKESKQEFIQVDVYRPPAHSGMGGGGVNLLLEGVLLLCFTQERTNFKEFFFLTAEEISPCIRSRRRYGQL